jgi:uncharacterized membrane protein (DUF2068 family)
MSIRQSFARVQPLLQSPKMLPAIGVFKLVKVVLLILTGLAARRLLHTPNVEEALVRFTTRWRFDPTDERVAWVLTHISNISPKTLRTLQIGTFIYAGLYGIEGVGLLLRLAWAEWMTTITTGGLIPLEIVEIARRTTALRIGLFVVNVAILIYLVWHLTQRHQKKVAERERRQKASAVVLPAASPAAAARMEQPAPFTKVKA